MEYITATADMADVIHDILHTTIRTVYPKYYPQEVADFFCRHHSREHILEGIASGNMGVLADGDVIVGTGCYDGNHITGVYVLPDHQKQGCGSKIMDCLETEISKKFDTVFLDASLAAVCLYEHRGYKTVGHGIYELENDVKLVYEIMEKKLEVLFGMPSDIESWMGLVNHVSWNFPGLETQEKIEEHKETVLRFMSKKQALCMKDKNEIIGVILFSRKHNMICCLAVSPQYRRCGIASKLLEKAISELNPNMDISVSTFREDDEKGIAPRALYKKFGFVEDELIEEFGYPNQKFVLHS